VSHERVEAAGPEGCADWLSTVPDTVGRLAEEWSLRVEAPFEPGSRTSWVAPVLGTEGADLVLKVGWAHWEAEHEADGLRVWAGHGAVRVYAAQAFGDTSALLLERCRPGTPLSARPEQEQDEILAGLLPRCGCVRLPGSDFAP
jgi:streptomycin 6-kinase